MAEENIAPNQLRKPQEVARRALVLFAVVRLALGAPQRETVEWLEEHSLWHDLTPSELAFVSSDRPAQQDVINASWRAEALLVLVWALGLVPAMPPLNQTCDVDKFRRLLPPYVDESPTDFIASAACLPDDVLLDFAVEVMDSHWVARDASIHGRPIPSHLHVGVVQERHHAINWVTGYGDLPWDDVTTDT